jgi:iron(III) transport system permease protein
MQAFKWALPVLLLLAIGATIILFADARVGRLLGNTLILAAGCCAIALPCGLLLAVVLTRTDLPFRRVSSMTLLSLLFLPLYLQAAGWDAGFGRQGWFSLSHGNLATPVLSGWTAAIWIHGVAAIPWVFLIVGLGLRYVESELEESAMLESSGGSVFWHVTLWRILPAVCVAALWVTLTVATEMTVTDLYQVRTLAEEIYMLAPQFGANEVELPWTSLLLAVVLLTLVALAATYRLAPSSDTSPRSAILFRLGRRRGPAVLAVLLAVSFLFGIPLINLLINAGMTLRPTDGVPARAWDVTKAAQIVAHSPFAFSAEFFWTILIGSVAGFVALTLGVPLAWFSCRNRLAATLTLTLSAVCLALPGPIVGLGIIWLLNRDSDLLLWLYDRTILAPVLAMIVRALPLTVLISWYALRSVGSDVLDLAATEGAGSATRFNRIAVAQRGAALATAWMAAMALTMGDLSASILVVPPGVSTVSLRVFGLLHAGVDDQVAGLCLTAVALFIILAGLAIRLWPQSESRVSGI